MPRLSAAAGYARDGHPYDFELLPVVGLRGVRVNLALMRSKWDWLDAKLRMNEIGDAKTLRLESIEDASLLALLVEGVLTQNWYVLVGPILSKTPSYQFSASVFSMGVVGCDCGVEACERRVLETLDPTTALLWTPHSSPLAFTQRFHRKVRECSQQSFPYPLTQSLAWSELKVEDVAYWLSCNEWLVATERDFLIALSWWWRDQAPARKAAVQYLLRDTQCFRQKDETPFEFETQTSHPLWNLVRDERLWRAENNVVEIRPRPWAIEVRLGPHDPDVLDWTGKASCDCDYDHYVRVDGRLTIGQLKIYIQRCFAKHGMPGIVIQEVMHDSVLLAEDGLTLASLGSPEALTYSYEE